MVVTFAMNKDTDYVGDVVLDAIGWISDNPGQKVTSVGVSGSEKYNNFYITLDYEERP